MRDNDKLVEGDDYTIDLDKMELVINKAKADSTYHISVFINNSYTQNLLENYNELMSSNEPPVGRVTDKTIVTKKDAEKGLK